MHLVIFQLDPAAPWIVENRPVTPAKLAAMRADPGQMDLRRRWTLFAETTAAAFRTAGWRADVRTMDRWAIDAAAVDAAAADLVFVPHSTRAQLGAATTPVFFYMQVMQRWLFTADPQGWGAGSSRYPCTDYARGDASSDVWPRYRRLLAEDNTSKFAQAPAAARADLVARGAIPDAPFVFFPCQIPHDESLTLFSAVAEADLVAALAAWSRARGVPVVFKEHPANRGAMAPLRAAAGAGAFWSEASVHDLIREAAAVYTLNSGVGFETLVHETPLVAFARAEYDVVAVRGDLLRLDDAWQACQAWDRDADMIRRRRFVDWYCTAHAVDLDADAPVRARRLALLVEEASSLCRRNPPST